MRKIILISIIFLIVSISCIYANESNIENNTQTNPEPTKYYIKDIEGGSVSYFYENGTIAYKGDEFHYRPFTLNKEQINYFIENGELSYTLAYLKYNHEHGGNLTYDEVYNSSVQVDSKIIDNCIFYNNGTVTRNITMHYLNGTEKFIPYSTTFKTNVLGVAQWYMETDIIENEFGNLTSVIFIERDPSGFFYYNDMNGSIDLYNQYDNILVDDNTTNQTITNTNNTNNQIITNTNNTTNQNATINNTIPLQYKEDTIINTIQNTANPLIVLLIACILIPIGIHKKRK